MEQSDLKFNLLARCARFVSFLVFSFILFGSAFQNFLYAAVTVKSLSFDAEAEKVVWKEEDGKLKITAVGELHKGEALPDTCRICVSEGKVVVEKDGNEIKINAGEFFDSKDEKTKKAQASYVKVTEGKVAYQDELVQNGVRKPLGDPILVDKGMALVRVNDCYHLETMSILDFEDSQAGAQAATAPLLPSQRTSGGEDPTRQPSSSKPPPS